MYYCFEFEFCVYLWVTLDQDVHFDLFETEAKLLEKLVQVDGAKNYKRRSDEDLKKTLFPVICSEKVEHNTRNLKKLITISH